MHKGPETRELIEKSAASLFDFANSIVNRGGFDVNFGTGTTFVKIEVLFVSDLKMLPLVFGVSHSSSRTFCPMCLVERPDHRIEASFGQMRNPITDEQANPPLLQIPVQNIVCPPLHLLQGVTNKVLELMDAER